MNYIEYEDFYVIEISFGFLNKPFKRKFLLKTIAVIEGQVGNWHDTAVSNIRDQQLQLQTEIYNSQDHITFKKKMCL